MKQKSSQSILVCLQGKVRENWKSVIIKENCINSFIILGIDRCLGILNIVLKV